MRKFFGSRVIQASKSKPSSSGPSTSRRQANAAAQRSNLTRPQSTWRDANQREGLSMRSLTQEEVKQNTLLSPEGMVDERWWTVEYSKRYKSVTMAFMQAVMAGGEDGPLLLSNNETLLTTIYCIRSTSVLGPPNETPMARRHPSPTL